MILGAEEFRGHKREFRGHNTELLTLCEETGTFRAWQDSREWWFLGCRTTSRNVAIAGSSLKLKVGLVPDVLQRVGWVPRPSLLPGDPA